MPQGRTITADLSEAELTEKREQLEKKRDQIYVLLRHDVKAGQESTDENFDDSIDRANNAYARELNFSLSNTEREQVIQIDDALERLKKGTYGVCENCETVIPKARLDAVPWARYCIDCQEQIEMGLLEG